MPASPASPCNHHPHAHSHVVCPLPALPALQHTPVYTVGKRGREEDFRVPREALAAGGAEVYEVPRGGETTYHGPGQLVVYPILSLRGLGLGARAYVEGLEDVMVKTVGQYGISARVRGGEGRGRGRSLFAGWLPTRAPLEKGRLSCPSEAPAAARPRPPPPPAPPPRQGRVKCKPGAWVGDRKIGAVGVRITHGVTSHGAALNVSTPLSAFDGIVPCGTPDKGVTSMELELGAPAPPLAEVVEGLAEAFRHHYGYGEARWLAGIEALGLGQPAAAAAGRAS